MFRELFEPMTIGPMKVVNRVMMSAMSAGMMLDRDGQITPEMIAYFIERVRNNPGMAAVGACAVVPTPEQWKYPVPIYSDHVIPSLKRLVDAVHQYDTKFGIQLWDPGGTEGGKRTLISPSGLSSNARAKGGAMMGPQVNRGLELDEIGEVVGYFARAAARCEEAGLDFVEIHAGHGYLISNFLTPLFNRRTDHYGGSFENRIRFLIEIVRAIKAVLGNRVALGVKFNGDDFLPSDGWTLADSCRLAPILQAEGADYLNVTAGVVGAPRLTIAPMYEPQGCYTHLAEAVKPQVSIPVGTIGRIKNPEMANDLIAQGKVDFVGMGRPMIADPDIVGKARRGELDEIRKCLADCRGCMDEHMRSARRGEVTTSCVVNPRMARESVCIDIEGASKHNPKKVLVVGAGLAGLEAARRTAFSGHHVILCESRDRIGGQIRLAALMPGRQEIADMLPWYERQIAKYGVDVRLNTMVNEALLDSIAPDVVFVATGSVPQVPSGMIESVSNAASINVAMIDDLLEEGTPPGNNILVIGGDQIGMQAADFLSEGGRKVCVAEAHGHFAPKLAVHDRWYLLNRTDEKNVRRFKNVHNVVVDTADNVWIVTEKGREHLPGIDTIVFASERRSNRSVAKIAEAKGLKTHIIGDAFDVVSEDGGTIFATIAQAYDVARFV
ncbi:FAD-dependent oxidoreductase [Bradyrhizobium sp. AUGA SZCCT0240]|uniref:oxidoreductase n=1 Tax=Bradyrhizobium sp. AUGA SZCCT0240 TaxID=2807669 RepID=UPI001BA46CEE|nr:FAD-dependent oxidoreductase [Bradyrhizobium sp. AUGA SZCCT0240]MBR1256342.1 FAD-dependent oxidoreductase [Bradyrhizobium sp. AUGA SZCCT0240]